MNVKPLSPPLRSVPPPSSEPLLEGRLASLSYRSRAVAPLSELELRQLQWVAQARNRAEGITGMVVYDDGRFFQWLEGPADALARLWKAIARDKRHTDIEATSILPMPARVFAGWDMLMSVRGTAATGGQPASPESGLVLKFSDALVADAQSATSLLLQGAPVSGLREAGPVPLLPMLIEAIMLPHLAAKNASVRRSLPPVDPVSDELARLLLGADPRPASNLISSLYDAAGALAPLCATIIEPAARRLGDLWSLDSCSQFDVAAALARVDTTLRALTLDAPQTAFGLPAVLVAPQPGEPHLLGSSIDADLLWHAGWDTHRGFPETDLALQGLVAATWFDVLDLSMSGAFAREDWVPRMADTIARARTASLNPGLVVVVGGRAFFERGGAGDGADVGADASLSTALHLTLTTRSTLAKHRAKRPSRRGEGEH